MTAYVVEGQTVTLPVQVRVAQSWAAQYRVDKAAAARLVDPTGLKATGLVSLAFVRYEDGDLGAYDEFALNLMVRDPVGGKLAAYIHRLPVNQTFTCEAGRKIWGYPKWVTDVRIGGDTCSVGEEARLTVRRGWVPFRIPAVPTFSFTDGVLRRTEWQVQAAGVRARPGGATLELGQGDLAEEIRSLGLPKRPLMSTTIASFRVSFGPAEVIDVPRRDG